MKTEILGQLSKFCIEAESNTTLGERANTMVKFTDNIIEIYDANNASKRLLSELRQIYLVDIGDDGQPKASLGDILEMWDKVNKELRIDTGDKNH